MFSTLKYMAAAAIMAVLPMSANAISLGATDIGPHDLLAGPYDIDGAGLSFDGIVGPTDLHWTFTIDAANAPQPAIAGSANLIFNGEVTDLTMNWASGDMDFVPASSSGPGGFTAGDATVFSSGDFTFTDILDISGNPTGFTVATLVLPTLFTEPGQLSQTLNFGFSGFKGRSLSISIDVAAVPLPASLVLFLSALGGMGLLARRRKTAVA